MRIIDFVRKYMRRKGIPVTRDSELSFYRTMKKSIESAKEAYCECEADGINFDNAMRCKKCP